MSQTRTIGILGGGAAGFFSALNIAEKDPGARITIYEASASPLQKVRISGGGRCNVTHHCFDPRLLIQYYPRGAKELRSLFARFQPGDMVDWLQARGLTLKTEPDGRMFPVTDRSESVIELFTGQARQLGIRLETRVTTERVERLEDGGFRLHFRDRASERVDALVLATGYSPPGWKLAESLGHTIIPPVPSLFPFKITDPAIAGLQGIAVPAAGRLKAGGEPFEAEGDVLITHHGLSGPLIYRLSALGARALAESRYHGDLRIDWVPALSEETLRQELTRLFSQEAAQKQIKNTRFAPLPHRLWLSLLAVSGADLEARGEVMGKKPLNRLVENLKRLPLTVSGRNPSKEEFVSCGGVALPEVDFRTMQSRRVPNLYFAGEILAIDGLTGGFNFQACWSAAWTLSEALA